MKLYAITIRPTSGFGTSLKGDTIFGQFCWEVAQDPGLVNGDLAQCLGTYDEKPFVVFSSAFPTANDPSAGKWYALKRPDVPLHHIWNEQDNDSYALVAERKQRKSRKWMIAGDGLSISLQGDDYLSDTQLVEKISLAGSVMMQPSSNLKVEKLLSNRFSQPHNTINRITNTTGTGSFAPFAQEITFYLHNLQLAIFALVDTEVTDIDSIVRGFERMGSFGYGKDASIGVGRFAVVNYDEISINHNPSNNAVYCLGPCVPRKGSYKEAFFLPFVRYGKHGNILAQSSAPFKNPVIMADEGAVFLANDSAESARGYFGSCVRGVSKVMPRTVTQGYTITIPFKLEAPE